MVVSVGPSSPWQILHGSGWLLPPPGPAGGMQATSPVIESRGHRCGSRDRSLLHGSLLSLGAASAPAANRALTITRDARSIRKTASLCDVQAGPNGRRCRGRPPSGQTCTGHGHARRSPAAARAPTRSAVLDAFAAWAADGGRPLYPHQEEAAFALAAGDHVVLATPTGSGKSLVAVAGMLLARNDGSAGRVDGADQGAGRREVLRPRRPARRRARSGLATGDAAINADAPVLVCTAEVLANHALVTGPASDVRVRLPRRVPLLRRRRPRLGVAGPAARADELPDAAGVGDARRHDARSRPTSPSGRAARSPR